VDLYRLFEAAVREEQSLRSELERYAVEADPPITPVDVPPLVEAHIGVMPTAPNKMFNAQVLSYNFAEKHIEKVRAPVDPADVAANEAAARRMLDGVDLGHVTFALPDVRVRTGAVVGVVSGQRVAAFLSEYRWLERANALRRECEFIEGAYGDPGIRQWLLYAPQIAQPQARWEVSGESLAVLHRTGRYRSFSQASIRTSG
jgi:hypothetical protein